MMSLLRVLTLFSVLFQLTLCATDHATPEAEAEEVVGSSKNVALGFGLVIFGASLSTLGAMVLYLDKLIIRFSNVGSDFSLSKSNGFLSSSLSFSAGVLAVTIFINLLPEGIGAFENSNLFGDYSGLAAASYFSICMAAIVLGKVISRRRRNSKQKLLKESSPESPPEPFNDEKTDVEVNIEETVVEGPDETEMKRLGYEIALAIALHNFPEGVVTFVASYKSFKGGLLFGIALALHKFPEGIMIGVPIFAGTGSKWKAAAITAAASFITQLLGALFAFLLFKVYWNDIIAGVLFLLAAAILTNTLFGGMLPLARSYDKEDKYSSIWLAFGVTLFIFMTSVIKEE